MSEKHGKVISVKIPVGCPPRMDPIMWAYLHLDEQKLAADLAAAASNVAERMAKERNDIAMRTLGIVV